MPQQAMERQRASKERTERHREKQIRNATHIGGRINQTSLLVLENNIKIFTHVLLHGVDQGMETLLQLLARSHCL